MYKYILKGKVPIIEEDPIKWATFFGQSNRRVAEDTIEGIWVSTVFLGIDHQYGGGPPLLFETMIFGGDRNFETHRYSTWEEAEEGHKKIVRGLTKNSFRLLMILQE